MSQPKKSPASVLLENLPATDHRCRLRKVSPSALLALGVVASGSISVTHAAPVARNDVMAVQANTSVSGDVGVNDEFVAGQATFAADPSTGLIFTDPSKGTFTIASTGAPPLDYGSESRQYGYTLTEGGETASAILTLHINSETNTVFPKSDIYSIPAGQPFLFKPYANDDVSKAINPIGTNAPFTGFSNGVVIDLSDGSFDPNASFLYIPNAGFTGWDSDTYLISEPNQDSPMNNLASAVAVVSFQVNAAPVPPTPPAPPSDPAPESGTGPIAKNDSYGVYPGSYVLEDVTLNDGLSDLIAHPEISAQVVLRSLPTYAQNFQFGLNNAVSNTAGQFYYTPTAAGFGQPDSFTYSIILYGFDSDNEPLDTSTTATVFITPVVRLVPDVVSAVAGTPLNASVTGNDNLNQMAGGSFRSVDAPTHGSLTFNADGTYVYTPNASYAGPDEFTYELEERDSQGNVLGTYPKVTVSITVTAAAPPPPPGPPPSPGPSPSPSDVQAVPVMGGAGLAGLSVLMAGVAALARRRRRTDQQDQ